MVCPLGVCQFGFTMWSSRPRIAPAALFCTLLIGCAGSPKTTAPPAPGSGISVAGTSIRFATAEEAARLLGTADAFTARLSEFDRAVRTGEQGTSTDAFLAYVAAQARGWRARERAAWSDTLRRVAAALEGLSVPLPPEIVLIRTSGKEEFGAAHTRGAAILLPSGRVDAPDSHRLALAAHELFHVASRFASPQWRDAVYGILGFERRASMVHPPEMESRRVTNPDAFSLEHVVPVRIGETGEHAVAPLLATKLPLAEAVGAGGPMTFVELLLLRPDTGEVFDPAETDYHRRVGRNTAYVIHPEEALADQFSLLVMRRAGESINPLPAPEVVDALEARLSVP